MEGRTPCAWGLNVPTCELESPTYKENKKKVKESKQVAASLKAFTWSSQILNRPTQRFEETPERGRRGSFPGGAYRWRAGHSELLSFMNSLPGFLESLPVLLWLKKNFF